MSNEDKNIPTLDEMIFPGKSNTDEKVDKNQQSGINENKKQPTQSIEKKLEPDTAKAKPKRTNFESMVNRQVDAILTKHMKAARAEIVRAVMIELRSRLPVTNRKE